MKAFIWVMLALTLAGAASAQELVIFYGQGCPHCASLKNYLDETSPNYPNISVKEYEVYFNAENRQLFQKMSHSYGREIPGVPTTFINGKMIVGFSSNIASQLQAEMERCSKEKCVSPFQYLAEEAGNETVQIIGDRSPAEDPTKTQVKSHLTIWGVLSAAAVDAINPCAFAVLIILMTTILAARKKAIYAGLAFTTSIYISYLLMGIGLFSAIQAAGVTTWFYRIVAGLAIIIGLLNLKDYIWYGKWFKMEVPESWRPKMKAVLRGVTSVPGAFLIGFVVSLFLLPCTSGPYLVILGLLAKTATRDYAFMLLLLYNLIFILPMLTITLGIHFGLTTVEQAEKWRKGKLEVLHLIAGAILILLGIAMFIAMYYGML